MNTSTSNDGLDGSSMMSFVAMESGSNNGSCSQKQPQLWDWDYSNQSNNNTSATPIVTATTATTSFITNGDGPFWDSQTSLLPMTANFPLYLPVSSDFHHHHHYHDPNGLIKVEDGREGQIGLNLGHRTYFSSEDSLAIDRLFRRSRGLYQLSQHVPRCQAEECKADLSGAKHYHRRHKVCEFHSKATAVVANGLHQRFCQQCSRFHVLSEFDETKRSCRKRLADHNRRRRKPYVPNNSMITSSAEEIKEQQQTISHHNSSKQICSATVITNSTSTGAFSASCVNTDNRKEHQQQQNNDKVGKGLSLGGAEDGKIHSLDHHHHRSRQSSPATYYHHQHHNLFNDMASGVGSSSSDQANQQPNNPMFHLGQELFPMDLV